MNPISAALNARFFVSQIRWKKQVQHLHNRPQDGWFGGGNSFNTPRNGGIFLGKFHWNPICGSLIQPAEFWVKGMRSQVKSFQDVAEIKQRCQFNSLTLKNLYYQNYRGTFGSVEFSMTLYFLFELVSYEFRCRDIDGRMNWLTWIIRRYW